METVIIDTTELFGDAGNRVVLTTDHPASSYGQPVLVQSDGVARGPADPSGEGLVTRTAAEWVLEEAAIHHHLAADPLVAKFLSQSEDYHVTDEGERIFIPRPRKS